MVFNTDQSAILLLEDGVFFEGISFGAVGTISGEVVFNTGMTGYQEVITDPSYCGQLIVSLGKTSLIVKNGISKMSK